MARQPSTGLLRWQQALTSVATQPATAVFIGSSTTQGSMATSASRRYIEVLGGMLRRRISATENTHTHIATSADDDAITKTGTITRAYTGLSRQIYIMSAGATIGFNFSGQALTILYVQGASAGALSVVIDGGAPTVITPATSGASAHTGSSTISGLSAGAHTVVITALATTRFCGAIAHSGQVDRGLYIYNDGIGGATTQMFADDASHLQRLQTLSPHLAVIMLGSNDYASNVALTTYMTKAEKLIRDLRAMPSSPAILLVHSYQRFDVASPTHTWAEYGTALRAVARSTNSAFVDLSPAYPTSQATDIIRPGSGHVSEGLISNDGIHQTDYGYAYMARLLLDTML